MPNRIKVGVIGVGHLGSIHARIYSQLPQADLVGVYDLDPSRANEIAAEFGCEPYSDFRQLIQDTEAISVAVPTDKHYSVSKVCLEQGRHLLIEKPITHQLRQADALLELAQKQKRIIHVGHVERFNSAVLALGKISNKPRFIECHRLAPFNVRGTEVGVVLDLMIHDIDIALGLVGSHVKEVRAVGLKVLSSSEDIANVRLEFRNGVTANLTASRISDIPTRKIRIFQKDTYISLDYREQGALVYRKKGDSITRENLPIQEKVEPLKSQLAEFLNCVSKKSRSLASARRAREALALALEIQTVIRRKRS